jgi:hypothetical protein
LRRGCSGEFAHKIGELLVQKEDISKNKIGFIICGLDQHIGNMDSRSMERMYDVERVVTIKMPMKFTSKSLENK